MKMDAGGVRVCEFGFSTVILESSGTDTNVICVALNFDFLMSDFALVGTNFPSGETSPITMPIRQPGKQNASAARYRQSTTTANFQS